MFLLFQAALLCKMSILLNCLLTLATACITNFGLDTSQATPMALTLYFSLSQLANLTHAEPDKSTTATFTPNSANPEQKCFPSKPKAPVTMAFLPFKLNCCL